MSDNEFGEFDFQHEGKDSMKILDVVHYNLNGNKIKAIIRKIKGDRALIQMKTSNKIVLLSDLTLIN